MEKEITLTAPHEGEPHYESPAQERFWERLLTQIEAGNVIPVIGHELLTLQGESGPSLFLSLVARELADQLTDENALLDPKGLPVLPTLSEVAARFAPGRGIDWVELFGMVEKVIRCRIENLPEDLDGHPEAFPRALLQIASIQAFPLLVSTTMDPLLQRAAEYKLQKPLASGQVLSYSANVGGSPADLPLVLQDVPVVYHLFGRMSAAPNLEWALTEGQILEFITELKNPEKRPRVLFDSMRERHLLVLGLGFPDGLARFFLRLIKGDPLERAEPSGTLEFVMDSEICGDSRLALFLEHFSKTTRRCPGTSAVDFVDKLHRRWTARCSRREAAGVFSTGNPARNRGQIFVSYATQDRAVVRNLVNSLKAAGLNCWFCEHELVPGDLFEPKIIRAIEDAACFLPVISKTTHERTFASGGWFWREWNQALQCYKQRPQDNPEFPYFFPVVIEAAGHEPKDETPLTHVPEPMRRAQLYHIRDGVGDERLIRALVKHTTPRGAFS